LLTSLERGAVECLYRIRSDATGIGNRVGDHHGATDNVRWIITMKYEFAVEVEADNLEALDILVSATEKWFKSVGSTIIERVKSEEDCAVAFHVKSRKNIQAIDRGFYDLPGQVSIERL
jgi:hypothetical protein